MKFTDMRIESLGLSKRPLRILKENNIQNLGQLLLAGRRNIEVMNGMGSKSAREIYDLLLCEHQIRIPRRFCCTLQEQKYLNELLIKTNEGLEDECK